MYEEEKKERFIKGSSIILLIWTIAFAISFVFNSIRIVWKETENENTYAKISGEMICEKLGGIKVIDGLNNFQDCVKQK